MAYCFLPYFQEKYKRALADTENLRTRSQKMIEDAKLYGNDQFSTFQQDPPHNMGFTSMNPVESNLSGLDKYSAVAYFNH